MLRYIYILSFLLLGLSQNLWAQIYPIQITTSIRGPYSLNLTDYAQPTYDRINTNIFCADLTKVDYPIKLRLVIRGPGGINISTLPGYEVGPILLDGGTTVPLTGAELSSMFNPDRLSFSGITKNQYLANRALPEGIYQFHFEALDFNINAVVSNVNIGFASAWLILNDPPIINKPVNEATVQPLNPQNIFFQWTPRHTGSPNAATSVEYDIQLVEVYPFDRNANDAMLSAPPIFETTTTATAYNFGMQDPTLVEGKWYAFRIRARDVNGLDLFKNQGYSEVYKFYYGQPCPPVTDIQAISIDNTTQLISFTSQPDHQSFIIEYKRSIQNWSNATTIMTNDSRVVLAGLQSGESYQIRITSKCINNQNEFDTLSFLTGGLRQTCQPPISLTINRKDINNSQSPIVIQWLNNSLVQRYEVRIQTASANKIVTTTSNSMEVVSLTDVTGASIPVPDNFQLMVSVYCKDGSFTSGDLRTIQLIGGSATSANCVIPEETEIRASQIDPYSVRISWNPIAGFKQYRFRYRLKGSNSLFLEVITSATDLILSDLDKDQMYEYQIQYQCADNRWMSGNSNVFSIFYDPTLFQTPTTGECFPPSGLRVQVRSSDIADVAWETEKGVRGYQLFYRPINTLVGVSEQWQVKAVSGNSTSLKSLIPNNRYEISVRSQCSDGSFSMMSDTLIFDLSNVNSFTGTCATPRLNTPEVLGDDEALIDWDTRVEYTKFTIQYRTVYQTEWTQVEDTLIGKYLDNLLNNTTYVYRVQAFCGTQESNFTVIDTFKTYPQGLGPNNFQCGGLAIDQLLANSQPIESFQVGDSFKAADFELVVSEFTTERPYNGIAVVNIPYLEHSNFEFEMENVWVNQDGRMYEGRVIMKGLYIHLIDPELSDQIWGMLEDLDEGLEDLSNNLAKADSIQDALNEAVGAFVQPIDWDAYDGWTGQMLLDTAKAMAQQAQALLASGSPQNVTQGKLLMIKAIELMRMAAVVGNETFQRLSEEAQKWRLRLKEILDRMKEETTVSLEQTTSLLDQLAPPLVQKYVTLEPAGIDTYEFSAVDVIFGDLDTVAVKPSAQDSLALAQSLTYGSVYQDGVAYRSKEHLKRTLTTLLDYITLYSRDANMVKLAKKMERDLADVINGRDLNQLSQAELTELEVVVEDYLVKFFAEEEKIKATAPPRKTTAKKKKANKKAKSTR